MITKRSKVYVPRLHTRIKYKSITFCIKNKKRLRTYTTLSKGTPKNKQNELRQIKKDEIKEESYSNYATVIKYAFCFLVCLVFHEINLLNTLKKCVYFVFIFYFTLSLSVTIIQQKACGCLKRIQF